MISFLVLNSMSAVPSYPPQLGQGRPHVAEDLGVVLGDSGRPAAAEELLGGQELLVDLEAGHEPDPGVVLGGHWPRRLEGEVV